MCILGILREKRICKFAFYQLRQAAAMLPLLETQSVLSSASFERKRGETKSIRFAPGLFRELLDRGVEAPDGKKAEGWTFLGSV